MQNYTQGEHKRWGTLVFNYGRSEVQELLCECALHGCEVPYRRQCRCRHIYAISTIYVKKVIGLATSMVVENTLVDFLRKTQ